MKPKAVIYTRVSTDEQAKQGYSLRAQEEKLRAYCQSHGWEVVKHYQDDESAKNFNRPAFQKFLRELSSIKPNILLCWSIDRFSRNAIDGIQMEKHLNSKGVEVKYASGVQYDARVPESMVGYHLGYVLPEVENARRALNTRAGQRRAQKEGRWMGVSPRGYSLVNKMLKPNEDAYYIVELFEEVSLGLETVDAIRFKLRKKGFNISKNQVYNILRNPVYIGKIRIKSFGDELEEIVDGLHDPIISEELFLQVQEVLEPNSRKGSRPKKIHEDLPMRGHLICPRCGNNLTGSTSNNGRGNSHAYYHCQAKYGCKERQRAEDVNEAFVAELRKIEVPSEVSKLFLEIMRDTITEKNGSKEKEEKRLQDEMQGLAKKLDVLDDKLLNGELDSDSYQRILKRLKSSEKLIKQNIKDLQLSTDDFDKYIEFGSHLVSNISSVYKKASTPLKKRIIGSIYPEKLIYDGKKYRTSKRNKVFEIFDLKIRELDRLKKEKANISVGQSYKAPPLGLEPRTL